MKFHRVVGKIDQELVNKAEVALTKVFLELGLKSSNENIGTGMGGDPLIFSLLYPMQHIATMNIPTAGTDGKRYYWNPNFVLSKSRIGLRIVCGHEAWHAIYMHPQRRGSRHPKLWNIAVDFIVNWTVMQDIKSRRLDPVSTFKKELGNFVTLFQYAEHIKNPFIKINGSESWVPEPQDPNKEVITLPNPNDERELTEKEKNEIEKSQEKIMYFFADPDLPEDMHKPEKIYDYLWSLLPKCHECGKVGIYKMPDDKSKDKPKDKSKKKSKKSKSDKGDKSESESESSFKDKSKESGQEPKDGDDGSPQPGDQNDGQCCNGSGDQPGSGPGGCGTCSGGEGYDIFGFGDTLDEHMDSEESPEKTAKRIADAMESAKRMAGSVPGILEDELGKLMAPKIRWQDFIRAKMTKKRDGNSRNDWSRFRTRPLFAGLMIPKRVNQVCKFGCLLDTSGSMSPDDMAFGVSQLQSLDERSEGWVVPCDSEAAFDKSTLLRRANTADLCKIKVFGRGGTRFTSFFENYKKKMGEVDFLIIITDGFLNEMDVADTNNPGCDVIWLITSGSSFSAPFGRVFDLKDL